LLIFHQHIMDRVVVIARMNKFANEHFHLFIIFVGLAPYLFWSILQALLRGCSCWTTFSNNSSLKIETRTIQNCYNHATRNIGSVFPL